MRGGKAKLTYFLPLASYSLIKEDILQMRKAM